MRENPERLAWAVLSMALGAFILAAAGVPLGVRWYVRQATVARDATVEVVVPTVIVDFPGAATSVAITDQRREVPERASIQTDRSSQGIITLFEDPASKVVIGTVWLFPGTRVELAEMRAPRFPGHGTKGRFVVVIHTGRARIAVTSAGHGPIYFEVRTPQGAIVINEASILVEVGNQQTEVSVRYGSVNASSGGIAVDVGQRLRTALRLGQPPTSPVPAARDLITNGDFSQPLSEGWQIDLERLSDDVMPGSVQPVASGGRTAAFISRMGADGQHTATALVQKLDRDARDLVSLRLRLDIRLVFQSLSGGGLQSSEFPLMVRLDYVDSNGNPQHWVRGFYYRNPDNLPVLYYGLKIPQNTWYPYESENLVEALADLRPAKISSIRIYGSGWNYQSMVAEVGLIAE